MNFLSLIFTLHCSIGNIWCMEQGNNNNNMIDIERLQLKQDLDNEAQSIIDKLDFNIAFLENFKRQIFINNIRTTPSEERIAIDSRIEAILTCVNGTIDEHIIFKNQINQLQENYNHQLQEIRDYLCQRKLKITPEELSAIKTMQDIEETIAIETLSSLYKKPLISKFN